MSSSDGVPVEQGAVAGVGAFVVGLVLTLIVGFAGLSGGIGLFVQLAPLQGTIAAYTFLHLWPMVLGGGAVAGAFLLWTIVPIIVLIGAGYYVADSAGGRRSSGFRNGASITVGYLILTIISFLLLLVMGGSGQTGVNFVALIVGVVFTGILFPVVFGGIGGAIADGM